MPKIVCRLLSMDELDAFADLIRRSFATVAEEFHLTIENCPTNGAFLHVSRLLTERERGFEQYGLFEDGKSVGFMEFAPPAQGKCFLEKLAVLPEKRHLGYGKLLLQAAEARARALHLSSIVLSIIEENTRLKQWYIANGYKPLQTMRFPNLPFLVGFMEKELEKEF